MMTPGHQRLVARREFLRWGAVTFGGGLSLLNPGKANSSTETSSDTAVIFVLLQGGPSHIDLWDPKPSAGSDVRGPFSSIGTPIPGVRFGELMSASAKVADRLTLIRSMTHPFTNHIAGTYVTLTGSNDQRDQDREAHPDDFPGPGAIAEHLFPGKPAVPSSVSLPNWLSIPGPSNRMPGQYGGFLGSVRDPFLLEGDPQSDSFDPLGMRSGATLSNARFEDRRGLLQELDRTQRWLDDSRLMEVARFRGSAFELLADGKFTRALDLTEEPEQVRDRYGRNRLGQSLLLARRLVESGVRWIAVNEFNQKWDTHGDLQNRYRDIVPPMDRAFASLIEDLSARGLLDKTLVVLGGEFGRTPRINDLAGRDHWPNAYSMVLAGGRTRGGTVIGETDRQGAEVLSGRVTPADLLATAWQHLGIAPDTTLRDRLDRPFPVTQGRPIEGLEG